MGEQSRGVPNLSHVRESQEGCLEEVAQEWSFEGKKTFQSKESRGYVFQEIAYGREWK